MIPENAQKVYDYLVMNPEKHNQHEWVTDKTGEYPLNKVETNFCGTTMCAAGAAVFLLKGKQEFKETVNSKLYYKDDSGSLKETWVAAGADALGISYNDGQKLFSTMSEEKALNMLNALAQGDMDKFSHIHETVEDEWGDA